MTLKDNDFIMYMSNLVVSGTSGIACVSGVTDINKKINFDEEPIQRQTSSESVDTENIKPIKKAQKIQMKILTKDFQILQDKDYNELMTINFNVKQLKEMSKHYRLKVSGTKNELIHRLYYFLKGSFFCKKIQKTWKLYLINKLNKLRGPGFINRQLCVNETDFLTMDNIKEILTQQFYSYQDVDNIIYGFDITSLYNLFLKSGIKSTNPYNRNAFPEHIRTDINGIIKISKYLGENLVITQETEVISSEKKLELRSVTLFDNIDALGNLTNHLWFWNLQRISLIRYLRELYDIWTYRAQLSQTVKREICPPTGGPFRAINVSLLPNSSIKQLRNIALNVMEDLVNKGINHGSKCLGAYYVLSALTLVNQEAANALPWLHESVVHN